MRLSGPKPLKRCRWCGVLRKRVSGVGNTYCPNQGRHARIMGKEPPGDTVVPLEYRSFGVSTIYSMGSKWGAE